MIPKKIYFFWGNKKMSWMRYMTLKSFKLFNPAWEVIVYTTDTTSADKVWENINVQDSFYFNGSDYMAEAQRLDVEFRVWDYSGIEVIKNKNIEKISPSQLSNFFKWYILATEGGVYCDMDVLFFRPIDVFYNEMVNGQYTTAICQTEYLSIGLLASAGNDDFFHALFVNSVNEYTPIAYQSAGVESIYKLHEFTPSEKQWIIEQILAKYPRFTGTLDVNITFPQADVLGVAIARYPNLKFYNILHSFIYAWDVRRIEDAFGIGGAIEDFPPEAFGYHWYAGHPIVQNFNNLLTANNYYRVNVLFTNIAKEILNETDKK